MKKAFVLMLAVLLLGTVGMAKTKIFDNIVVEGTATIQTLSVSVLGGAILAHEYGGLEADVSAYAGLVKITGGATSAVTVTSFAESILDDADLTAFYATTSLQTGSTILTYDVGLANLAGISMDADKFYYTSADNTHVAATVTSFARTIFDDTDIAAFYATTGLQTGSDILTYDVGLSNLAGVAMTSDQFYYTSGDNTHVAADVTTFARSILDDTTEGIFRATVNLEPGIDVQTYSANLVTYAAIAPSADIQSFLGSATDADARTDLGLAIDVDVQAHDDQLDDIAALVQSDSYIIVGDDTNWVAETGATARASLGLIIDTDVLSHDIGLSNLADIEMAANKFYYTSADNTHQSASITAFGRSILDDVDAAAVITTLGLDDGITILDTLADTPASPASGVALYWNGTNLVALNAAGQTESLTSW